LGRDQEAQYRAAVRLRNDFEYRFHSSLYTPRSIYASRHIKGDLVAPGWHVPSLALF
jgi:hypothetical protein